ncbi:MAG TPA: alpha/beta fold hydrolase [Devosia sp.]|uniref:alpha/beta fold hydrolase n=1 Tax=Devosia sp. TaxID=1871048 RepID=UPI002DDCA323|nr:alpha/beta fold hydrolase [Devosia sp.]HEV2515421.1 alpha/beta fold hydrolase [Devosia sp.]
MVEIKRPLKRSFDHVDTHVVFIHGLEGDLEGTWTSGEGSDAEFWPYWLEEELPNVAVWSVGYPASRSRWLGGIAMAPEDRAEHILQRLLSEPELANGTVILVGHSMGGVIIKEMLRLS